MGTNSCSVILRSTVKIVLLLSAFAFASSAHSTVIHSKHKSADNDAYGFYKEYDKASKHRYSKAIKHRYDKASKQKYKKESKRKYKKESKRIKHRYDRERKQLVANGDCKGERCLPSATVPEPGIFGLLAIGLLGMVISRRLLKS